MNDSWDVWGIMPNNQTAPSGNGGPLSALGNLFKGFQPQYNDKGVMTSQGWGGAAMGIGQGLFNAYMGMKQYGLYKDQLAESKRQFELNFDAQRRTTNAALADRQAARVAFNPNNAMSVADYMAKYGISGG